MILYHIPNMAPLQSPLTICDQNMFNHVQDPSHEDPLNHDAAFLLRDKPNEFRANVRSAMAGGRVGQTCFPPCPISHLSEKLNFLCFR